MAGLRPSMCLGAHLILPEASLHMRTSLR
ncbi:hypothetical protein CMEL01_00062 [Colletotrichum melonis]|uniref:Uncharacterized protein n=1 Tax=Colletotrichum melonis TaxID=1209925 RepID=A0AAI9V132_9PEZI|nr:hypothetical protein CMEL01_00062 [Colletotrichum melonis]